MSVLILEPAEYSEYAVGLYRSLGPVWMGSLSRGSTDQVKLLVVRLGEVLDAEFLSQFPNLIAIATPTTGLTHIDLNVCSKRHIRVFSLADCRRALEDVTSTSELTLGLILSLLRKIPLANRDVIDNMQWDRYLFRSRQLSRLTLGIIGLGRIGRHVASYANALRMNVLAFDPYQEESYFSNHDVHRCDLHALLRDSDIVSLHADLRSDNVKMIGVSELDLMKSNALLINTARGALVDEVAVAKALYNKRLGGVAVDVVTGEHNGASPLESPLVLAAKSGLNVLVTPHIGGCTVDAMHVTEEKLAEVVVRTLGDFE